MHLECIHVSEGTMADIGRRPSGYFWWNMVFNLISIRYKVTFFHNIKLKIETNYIYQSNEYQVTATFLQRQEQYQTFFFHHFYNTCNVAINTE